MLTDLLIKRIVNNAVKIQNEQLRISIEKEIRKATSDILVSVFTMLEDNKLKDKETMKIVAEDFVL